MGSGDGIGAGQGADSARFGPPHSAAEVCDAIGQLSALRTHLHCAELEWIAYYDSHELWRSDGATSMVAWLQALGRSHYTATEEVRIARALPDLPHVKKAYQDGLLSFDQLRFLARLATPDTDETLAEEARGWSVSELARLARRHRPVTGEEEEDAHRARHLRLRMDHERHALFIKGMLSQAQGEVLRKRLERIMETQGPASPHGLYEAYDQRCADALVELASVSISEDADPDRATVVVHADACALHGAKGVVEFESGGGMAPKTLERLSCDCRMQTVTHGPDGKAVAANPAKRTVPWWLAREIRRRDLHCRFPGCERQAWLQVHHVVPFAKGGPSVSSNLGSLCGTHHRWAHEGGGRIVGDADKKLRFFTPEGREIKPGPPPLRPEVRRRLCGEDRSPP